MTRTPTSETSPRARRSTSRGWAALLASLLSLAVLLPAGPAGAAPPDAWSSPSAGSGNAMVNAGESSITTGTAARVRRAWEADRPNGGGQIAPTVAGGTVFSLHRARSTDDYNTVVAASATTGRPLWEVRISRSPNTVIFSDGVTVAGSLVLVPHYSPFEPLKVTAVDRSRRTIAWTAEVPGDGGQYHAYSSHQVYTDGTRAFVVSNYTLAAFRLTDGGVDWTVRLPHNTFVGIAVGHGSVFVGYDDGPDTTGITAYAAATGRKLWTGPGQGRPVVAGGRVFASAHSTLHALNASGCGRSTCPAVWSKRFPAIHPGYLTLGAADARTVFVSYQRSNGADADYSGVLTRLSAATGARQWTKTLGHYFGPALRGGDVVWVLNAHRSADGSPRARILAFAATGTRTASLRSLPAAQTGSPQTFAVGGGTLLNQTHIPGTLIGYRVR